MNEFEKSLKKIHELCVKNTCKSCENHEMCSKTLYGAVSPEYWNIKGGEEMGTEESCNIMAEEIMVIKKSEYDELREQATRLKVIQKLCASDKYLNNEVIFEIAKWE